MKIPTIIKKANNSDGDTDGTVGTFRIGPFSSGRVKLVPFCSVSKAKTAESVAAHAIVIADALMQLQESAQKAIMKFTGRLGAGTFSGL
jgi:hypothetical protein